MHTGDLRRGTLRAIISQAGLTVADFIALLTEPLAELLADGTRNAGGKSAGRCSNDDRDRLRGILLRGGGRRHRKFKRERDARACSPSFGIGTCSGDRKGQYSIRINDQWRICFEWPEGSPGPVNVEITDYH